MSDAKLTVANEAPTSNGAVTTPTGGSWSVGTYSFKVMAKYSDNNHIDNYGVTRGTVAAWNNISVAAGDSVVIPITLDTARQHDIVVVYQAGASFNDGAAAVVINSSEVAVTQTAYDEYTITIDSGSVSDNLTVGASANTVEFSPPTTFKATYRQPSQRAIDGTIIKQDYIDSRILDTLVIDANPYLSVGTSLPTLQRWFRDQVYLKIEDTNSDTTSYFSAAYGTISMINAYNTRTDQPVMQFIFVIDDEDVS